MCTPVLSPFRGVTAISFGLLLLAASCTSGAVLTTNDAATLQQLINAGGEITFDFSDTIELENTLVVTNNVTLDGRDQTVTIQSIATNFLAARLFNVQTGAVFTIRNLSLSGGRATNGGAIFNGGGSLIVTNCTFTDNVALGPDGANGSDGSSGIDVGRDAQSGTSGRDASGGAIYNLGTAVILRSTFITNTAFGGNGGNGGTGGSGAITGGDGGYGGNGGSAYGGAMYNLGTLTLRECYLRGNQAVGGNGGLGGTNGSALYPGLAGRGGPGGAGNGAGFYNLGLASVEKCSLFGNNGFGGDSQKGGTTPTSRGDGYSGGYSFGGAICNLGTNYLVNCTAYSNSVNGGTGGDGGDGDVVGGEGGNGGAAWGGGVYSARYMALTNCTLARSASFGGNPGLGGSSLYAGDNGADGSSAGGNVANNGGTFILKNTILANPPIGTNVVVATNVTSSTQISNCITNVQNITNEFGVLIPVSTNVTCSTNIIFTTNVTALTNISFSFNAYGAFTDAGYNLSSDNTPALSTNSFLNTPANLGSLIEAGVVTPVLPTLANSLAINHGDPYVFPPTDQRGVSRPQGPRSDIGTYEREDVNLSGHVTQGTNGLAGVTITVGSTNVTTTDGNGYYSFTNLPTASYLVMPTLAGFDFSPPVRAVTIGPSLTNVDFAAIGIYSIRGQVLDGIGGTGLSGVTITTDSETALTDGNGNYTLENIGPGFYTVTAEKPGYSFFPASQQVMVNQNVGAVNFVFGRFEIMGQIIDTKGSGGSETVGLSNAVVTVSSTFLSASDQTNTLTFTGLSDENGY